MNLQPTAHSLDPLDRLMIEHELRDDPSIADDLRADPWLSVACADLLARYPPSTPNAASPTSTAPPRATPRSPLSASQRPHRAPQSRSPLAASERGARGAGAPTSAVHATPPTPQPRKDHASMTPQPIAATTSASADPLPLRHRIYARYCDGLSAAAIAREFALDRQTVTRHLRIIEEQLSREHTRDLARLRIRALQAQYRIQATALDALDREEALEAESRAAITDALAGGEQPPQLYRAQRARLLAVAASAARTAAQLQGLFYHPSVALVQTHSWITPYPPEAYTIKPATDPAPDLPDDAYDPTDPDDLPDPDDPDDLPTNLPTNLHGDLSGDAHPTAALPAAPQPATVAPAEPAGTTPPTAGEPTDKFVSEHAEPALPAAPQSVESDPAEAPARHESAAPEAPAPAPAAPESSATIPDKSVAFCGMPASASASPLPAGEGPGERSTLASHLHHMSPPA